MVTTVSGKHMEIGQALQQYVHDRIDSGVRSILHEITQAKVNFSKRSYLYHVDIIIHDSHIGLVKAENESDDVYAAFDTAIVKIERQLRKYKSKINRHAKSIKESLVDLDSVTGKKYVLNVPAAPESQEDYDHELLPLLSKTLILRN
jgi:ribosomal subunit interface protein